MTIMANRSRLEQINNLQTYTFTTVGIRMLGVMKRYERAKWRPFWHHVDYCSCHYDHYDYLLR